MNILPFEMREEQDKQRQEKIDLINKFKDKLKFSVISLLFFTAITAYTFFMLIDIAGFILPVFFGVISLVFIQQVIRSYNYLEFHKNNYMFMESVYSVLKDDPEKN